jgi:hypothetical protein
MDADVLLAATYRGDLRSFEALVHGQHFFVEVPVTDEEVELTFEESATVEGTITWADGTPASGLTVRVNGRLPEPPIPVERMGMRPFVVQDGLALNDKGRVRATAFVLEVRSADSKTRWKSPRLDGSAENAIDLGEIVLGE